MKKLTQIQIKPKKIIVLVGPTASGKSELAVLLAKKLNGEIVSADSRQIYKRMNLGTGKVPGKWLKNKFVYRNIPHYCIDYINPSRQYSSGSFQRDAKKAISDILKQGKLPILCGGSAHWVDAVIFNQQLPDVKPNKKLRALLEKKSTGQLFKQLQKLDQVRAQSIDAKNPHRLIRALEIVITTGKPVPSLTSKLSPLTSLWLGIKTNQSSIYKKIDKRLKERLNAGMIDEVKRLHFGSLPRRGKAKEGATKGLSWKKLESFGLEYKYISLYLQGKITYDEMFTRLSFAIKHYSKRQLTWWKKNKEIIWFDLKNQTKIFKVTEKFLK
jgi:tRNA dimethylallyltransferase